VTGPDLLDAYASSNCEFGCGHYQVLSVATTKVVKHIAFGYSRQFKHPDYLRVREQDRRTVPVRIVHRPTGLAEVVLRFHILGSKQLLTSPGGIFSAHSLKRSNRAKPYL